MGLPVFLRSPKSGGTAIETALGQIGISVGYCHKRPFEFREKFVGYEAWHTPPKGRVANCGPSSHPDRAQSEFLWRTNWLEPETFASLRPGYDPENCVKFQKHIASSIENAQKSDLQRCYQEKKYWWRAWTASTKIEGDMGVTSHWMPQSVMLAGAERVFRFEECMSPEEGRCPRPRGKGDQMNASLFCGQSITRRRRHRARQRLESRGGETQSIGVLETHGPIRVTHLQRHLSSRYISLWIRT